MGRQPIKIHTPIYLAITIATQIGFRQSKITKGPGFWPVWEGKGLDNLTDGVIDLKDDMIYC